MIHFLVNDAHVPAARRLRGPLYLSIAKNFAKVLPELQGDVSVTFVDRDEITRLNRMYRNKDAVTDVLSFALSRGPSSDEVGDVIICYERAVEQAEDGDIELEMVDLVVHGTLHIFGYDHEDPQEAKDMFSLQDDIVAKSL